MSLPSRLDEVLLDMVGMIPPGSLASYADLSVLAAELGYPCTPRRVARALSQYGSDVPWWRVVQSAGAVADQVYGAAAPLLKAEGVPLRGRRVPLERLRWSPEPVVLRQRVMALAKDPQATPPPV